MKMHCWNCDRITDFTIDSEEGPVCVCGHYQDSVASGAAELCEVATWHNLDAYANMSAVAQEGGYKVPENPNYFRE